MKKPTPAKQKRIDRLIKSEFERVNGPWPEGMTIKEVWQILSINYQEKEAWRTFFEKQIGLSPSEIKKADHDPDWAFFWGISAASNRDLKIDWVKNRLQKAIEQNDLIFFIRFGNELKRKPRQLAFDKVAFNLATWWATPAGKIPPLSWFTDEALVEMLKILTGNEKLTFDQVRKARQRLGLQSKNVQIKGVKRVGSNSFKLIWVDKPDL